jgi:glutathione S-transferase
MKFYDCATAPSPRRARIMIAEKGLEIETVQVDLRSGEHLTDAYKAINPNCTVPTLELDDGTRLHSTVGIWHYLEAAYPETPMMGTTAEEKGRIADLQWRVEMDGLMAVGEALRNGAPAMKDRALTGPHNYAQLPELVERGKIRVERFLDGVEEMIGDKPFAAGDTFSIADIDLLVVVDFAKWLKLELPESATRARAWHERVSARPSTKL